MNMVIATIGVLSLDIVEILIPIKKVSTAEAAKTVVLQKVVVHAKS